MERDSSPHKEDLWEQQGERISRGSGRGRGDEPDWPPAPPWGSFARHFW